MRRIFNLSCTATSKTDKSLHSICLFIFLVKNEFGPKEKENTKYMNHEIEWVQDLPSGEGNS